MPTWLKASARSAGIFLLLLIQGAASLGATVCGWPAVGFLNVATWARDRRRELEDRAAAEMAVCTDKD